MRKTRGSWSDRKWEEGKSQRGEIGVIKNHLTIFQKLLIILQNALMVQRWYFRFTVIWNFALHYFFSRKEGHFDVHCQRAQSLEGDGHKRNSLWPLVIWFLKPWAYAVHYDFLNASWPLTHEAVSKLNGGQFYRHFVGNMDKEFSWLFKKTKLHFQLCVYVHILLCFGKMQKAIVTWTVHSWPVKRMFLGLSIKIDFFYLQR